MEPSVAVLRRFNVPGPRYTSYPTAVEFDDRVGAADYRAHLAAAAARPEAPLSLYLHLPFCEERCDFCACNVIISPDHAVAPPYLARLKRELALLGEALGPRRRVNQYHWGGGTPTYLTVAEIADLDDAVRALFAVDPDGEQAIEVHPRVTTEDHLRELAARGFNRLSLGVQDFDPEVQATVNRHQSEAQTVALYHRARELGFARINLDLIYGLPRQSPATFARTIEKVLALRPDRLAVYSFAFVPWLKSRQRQWTDDDLPSLDEKFESFLVASRRLQDAGYEPIGMDHFALPDDELARARRAHTLHRNFMGYTVRPAPDQVAGGISGISDVGDGFFQNAKKMTSYDRAVDQGEFPIVKGRVLTTEDRLRRDLILDLMCNCWVAYAPLEARYGVRVREHFAAELAALAPYADEGFLALHDDALEVLAPGRFFVRNWAMHFDPYLHGRPREKPTFSKTV